ncbi:MAG: hypothetical protein F3745_01070 [Nitrospinae bacterium]|nr:hypothetical protein [Nitrospinota bacterium]
MDFNPVAYFNPSVVTDSGGNAVIEYELPDSITSYRVYVVACDKGNGFGNLELPLIASKDFYLEPGLPRFFAVGDKFNFLVKAINNTENSSNLDFTFDSTDGLTLFPKDNEYFLNSIDSTQIEVGGEALTKGNASVQLAGRFGNKQDAVRLEIPVHSGHTIGTDVVIGSFKRNTRLSLPVDRIKDPVKRSTVIENSDFKLTVSKTPFIRMSGGMAYLLQYPYGCVEQTSSRLMPLVALKGLIDDGQIPGITSVDTDKFINAGIKRLLTMQTESGGFGYWPGNKNPHKMGTLYAMTALSLARKNGIAVPEENMQKSIAFIKNLLNSSEKLTENFTAFGSYVLSLNDAYDPSTSDLLRRIGGKSTEADMFRLLARYNSGYKVNKGVGNFIQRTFFNNKLNVMPPSELGEFNAKHRYKAVSLLAANSIDPNHPLAHKMAKSLISGMDDAGFWSSTSDTGWALFALGEFYKNQKTSKVPTVVFVSQEGQSQNAVLKDKAFSTIDLNVSRNLENSKLELKSSTQEPIYYSATLKYPRLDYAESGYSNGFHISKVIENQSGSGDIHVGDIVKVKVSVDVENLSYSKPYTYVVIDDPLPSGLVAINSAIKTEEIIDEKGDVRSYWNSDGTYKLVPNFVEFKDDRVLVFKDKMYWNGTYQYTYYARAIMEGDFVLPSTKAQLMYSPQVAGFTHKDRIKIYGR